MGTAQTQGVASTIPTHKIQDKLMDAEPFLRSLVSAGRANQFDAVRSLPGAGDHSEVLRMASRYQGTLSDFFSKLDNEDRCCFTKALAVYEDSGGGVGSTTSLPRLLSLLIDPDQTVLDWILANTRRYYYSKGARSISELEAICRAQAIRRAESLRKEEERAAAARVRRAARATSNLYNAVRRGDIKAVASLLQQGADPNSTTPEGIPLQEFAVSVGRIEIAKILRGGV